MTLKAIIDHRGPEHLRRLVHRAIMVDRGLSLSDVAREAGTSKQAVEQYLSGGRTPQADARGLAKAEAAEDRYERAIEAACVTKGYVFEPSQVVITGPVDETGLPDFEFRDPQMMQMATRELMKAPDGVKPFVRLA